MPTFDIWQTILCMAPCIKWNQLRPISLKSDHFDNLILSTRILKSKHPVNFAVINLFLFNMNDSFVMHIDIVEAISKYSPLDKLLTTKTHFTRSLFFGKGQHSYLPNYVEISFFKKTTTDMPQICLLWGILRSLM